SHHPREPLPVKTVYLETFGCQMNELDSELVRGHLESLGYGFTPQPDDADVLLFNTCSVREHAESKAYSRVGIVGKRKKAGEDLILGVLGCMAERDGIDMLRRYPQIDLLCGPGELDKLPMLIDNVVRTTAQTSPTPEDVQDRVALAGNTSRRSAALSATADDLETLDLARAFDPDRATSGVRSAYVRITRGCNKFCTYCVVPYTRGAEVHRPPDSIVEECRRLAASGVIEVTLLGQTVNHYRYTHGVAVTLDGREQPQIGPGLSAFRNETVEDANLTTFAKLLARIHDEVPELARIRFLTSYPKDFGDDVLEVMASRPRICRYLHVPVQSGSNRILKLMNRGYTVEEYLEFTDRVLEVLPDASIAGDIIVGFPTESDEDFELTKQLLRRVPFKNNFIFKYSPRPGTTAINRFEDDVPLEVKKLRNNELLALQAEIGAAVHADWVGREVDVLVERLTNHAPLNRATASAVDPRISLGAGMTSKSAASVREPELAVQVSGRTSGDLITVLDVPSRAKAEQLLGTIVRVRIEGSGPLLLQGRMIDSASDS
ncbi:MiaB/RimO family radical SAM methylthiotransferase, partial [Phycisphaerales bacterium]|nr:MiaB/RimO family radical SAM methylthiotransferase [Phycisphaerales bacterium]